MNNGIRRKVTYNYVGQRSCQAKQIWMIEVLNLAEAARQINYLSVNGTVRQQSVRWHPCVLSHLTPHVYANIHPLTPLVFIHIIAHGQSSSTSIFLATGHNFPSQRPRRTPRAMPSTLLWCSASLHTTPTYSTALCGAQQRQPWDELHNDSPSVSFTKSLSLMKADTIWLFPFCKMKDCRGEVSGCDEMMVR